MVQQPRRRPTSADVAARAGVSRTTVSFVVNRRAGSQIPAETWQRVETAARELGYHPHGAARQLAAGRSLTLGLVLRQSADQVVADALLAETLFGLAAAARAGGYRVLLEPLAPGDGTYAELLRSQRTDGLIVSGPRADDDELVDLVRDGFPIVLQGSRLGLDAPSVDVDNRAGAHGAVAFLIGLGHRRIGCITNAPLAYTAATERLAGYRDALDEAAIAFDAQLVVEGSFVAASGHAAPKNAPPLGRIGGCQGNHLSPPPGRAFLGWFGPDGQGRGLFLRTSAEDQSGPGKSVCRRAEAGRRGGG